MARRLQKELPESIFLIKDDLKEFLFDALPPGDFEWSKLLGRVSIEALYAMVRVFLENDRDVLLENAFYKQFAGQDLPLFGVPVLEIYCQCDEEIRQKRYVERANTTRHPGHLDHEGVHIDPAIYAPLNLGETIYVNTNTSPDEKTISELASKVRNFLNGSMSSMIT